MNLILEDLNKLKQTNSHESFLISLENKGIKEEIARLKDLQKSKEKTIDNLKKIMAMAINAFGDTNKSGTKFLDYGTGKVSIRKFDSIEVDFITIKCERLSSEWFCIN